MSSHCSNVRHAMNCSKPSRPSSKRQPFPVISSTCQPSALSPQRPRHASRINHGCIWSSKRPFQHHGPVKAFSNACAKYCSKLSPSAGSRGLLKHRSLSIELWQTTSWMSHSACDKQNRARGMAWLERIHAHNVPALLSLFEKHRDFEFWIVEICYRIHLSDRKILDDLDTQLGVFPAVMGQICRASHTGILGGSGDWRFRREYTNGMRLCA